MNIIVNRVPGLTFYNVPKKLFSLIYLPSAIYSRRVSTMVVVCPLFLFGKITLFLLMLAEIEHFCEILDEFENGYLNSTHPEVIKLF